MSRINRLTVTGIDATETLVKFDFCIGEIIYKCKFGHDEVDVVEAIITIDCDGYGHAAPKFLSLGLSGYPH